MLQRPKKTSVPMRALFACGLTTLLLLVAAGCAKGPAHVETSDPFVIPKDYFYKTIKIIAVAAVTIPEGMPEPAAITEEFDSLIEDELRRGGYTIVRPQEYSAVWKRLSEEANGFIDPYTEERDDEMVVKAMLETLETLQADFDVHAVLIPDITVVEAPFAGGRAEWDGVSQSINVGGPMKGFFAGSPEGTLGALTLSINIWDKRAMKVYSKAGGLEVLRKMDGKEFVNVPRQDLFTDEQRNKKAVEVALDPLIK